MGCQAQTNLLSSCYLCFVTRRKIPMKIAIKIIFGLVVVLILAIIALLVFFDPNDYKPRIEALIESQTGREARIEGDLGWSFFPSLGIEAEGFVLENPPGFSDPVMLRVGSMAFSAELLPLLRGEIRVHKITLIDAAILLEVRADGSDNWSDLTSAKDETDRIAEETFARDTEEEQTFALLVETIAIKNASVNYRDAQQNQDINFTLHALETSNIGFDSTFPLLLDASITSEQLGNYQISLTSDVTLNADASQIALPNLALSVRLQDYADQTLSLATAVELDQQQQVIELRDLTLTGPAGLRLTGAMQLADYAADLRIAGSLTLHQLDPTRLAKAFGIDLALNTQAKVLQSLSGSMTLATAGQVINIAPLQLTLDDMTIDGSASLPMTDTMPIGFDLSISQLNLDNFMPPESSGSTASTASTEPTAADERAMNESLRGLNLDGKLKIGSITVAGLGMQNFNTSIKAGGGKIRLQPSAQLYGGNYSGNIGLDATGNRLSWSANEKLSGINIGPLLQDLVDIDRLTGSANLNMNLTGQGIASAQIFPSLNGSADFVFANGAVRGINLAQALRDAKAALGKGSPGPREDNKTDFTELRGTAQIRNGVVTNRDLLALSPYLRIAGDGTIDLPQGTVDYGVSIKVVNTDVGQGGAEFKDLEGYTIPIRVRGPFDSLSYSLDADALLKERANQEIEKQKAKVQEKIDEKKEELQDKVQDKLKEGLLRGLRF